MNHSASRRQGRIEVLGADHPQDAVAADAGATVAQAAYPLGGQVAVHRAVVVGQQHEVVLRAVALEEGVGGLSHRQPYSPFSYDGP